MVIERYIVKSGLMKFQREFFVTTICCLIDLFLPKIILVGIDDPKRIFMLVTFFVSSHRLVIFMIGLISVVEWLFFKSDRYYSATDTTFRYAAIQQFYFEQQILCDYHFDGGNPQPKYVYTKQTYCSMFFFFTWFTMTVVAIAVYTFDLF